MSNLIKTFTTDVTAPNMDKNAKRAKMVGTVIVGIILMVVLYYILPYAVTMVNNIVDLVTGLIYGGLLVIAAWLLFMLAKALRSSVGHWFEKLAYRALDAVIADKPTESMRIEIAKAEKKQKEYSANLGSMSQVVKDMQEREARQNEEALKELDAASHFKKRSAESTNAIEKQQFLSKETLARNSANNKKSSNDRMRGMKEKYAGYVERMQKLFDSLDFFIKDRTNLCNQLEADWEYARKMRQSAGLANESLELMEDDGIFMRAVRIAEQDISNSLAYVESAMQNSKSIIDNAELQKGMMDVSSQRLLDRYESGEFDQVITMMNQQSSLEDLKIRARHEIQGGGDDNANQLQSSFGDLYK